MEIIEVINENFVSWVLSNGLRIVGIITASFISPSSEMQPPEFQHMEMKPYFEANKEMLIEVDLHDESGIKEANIYARENGKWLLLGSETVDEGNYIYKALYTPTGNAQKIDVRI